jgi:hypothetical protein
MNSNFNESPDHLMIVEINPSVFFNVESEYGIGLSLTITIFALEKWQSFF